VQRAYDANSEMIFQASELQKHWWLLGSFVEPGCDTKDIYGSLARYCLYIMIICFLFNKITSFQRAIIRLDCDTSSLTRYQKWCQLVTFYPTQSLRHFYV
jgi:hypothetical protein